MARHRLLLVTRSQQAADDIGSLLQDLSDCQLSTKIVTNGHADPLQGIATAPDVLLLHCDNNLAELQFLADSETAHRVPLIVVGPANDASAMRLSIRAGASDYIANPVNPDELRAALERLEGNLANSQHSAGELIVLVNSCGGSGASFIASNLACAMHESGNGNTLLVDFDLQFGGLARYLDLRPKQGLLQALDAVEDMDEISAETYVTKHKSGLRLLAVHDEHLQLSSETSIERVEALISIFLSYYDTMVVDLPHRIDLLSASVLEVSDKIVIVMQQSILHLQNVMRMLHLISNELGIPRERILIALNRFDKKSMMDRKIVADTLKHDEIIEIPNQYQLVSQSINTGKPIVLREKHSPPARAICELQRRLQGLEDETPDAHGILGRAIPAILRRHV